MLSSLGQVLQGWKVPGLQGVLCMGVAEQFYPKHCPLGAKLSHRKGTSLSGNHPPCLGSLTDAAKPQVAAVTEKPILTVPAGDLVFPHS